MEKVDDIINEIDNTGEEIFAVKLVDFCKATKCSTLGVASGFSLSDDLVTHQFGGCITVVKYKKEDGKFEEFYTGLSLNYMPFSVFNKKYYEEDLTGSSFVQAYFELREKGPLFFSEMYCVDDEVKAKIFNQQDDAEEIEKEIRRIYNVAQERLEVDCKSEVESFLGVAYGENLLYDFKHGINRTRKIDITDKK